MAEFFGDRLLAGMRPDKGKIPDASEETQQLAPRAKKTMGARSGWMANNWDKGKVNGTSFKSDRVLKPNGGDSPTTDSEVKVAPGGRAFVIQNLLRRKRQPIDFQSVKGDAG